MLVNLVLDGKKPSTLIRTREKPNYPALDCEEIYFKHLRPSPYTTYALAQQNLGVRDLIAEKDLVSPNNNSIIQDKLILLYEEIKGKKVAPALKFLCELPRKIGRFNGSEIIGLETAENAILTGQLLGYKPCDIDYYIRTRYLNEKQHELEKPQNCDPNGFNVECYSCIKERISKIYS